ncbi:MAG TPA: Crp/Fnr family transcriptional regulator [Sporolactobacillaceae bacterium]|nr:Crp/Fnr family transcriptional regulator [Sporolactobacillaceae bacterium]
MGDMKTLLKSIPIFSELTPYELEQLTDISTVRNYAKKEYVFLEGEPRESVFFIQKGQVKTFKLDSNGNIQVISMLHEGDMFPHVGFFDKGPYPATAEAIIESQIVFIRVDDFNALLTEKPGIALKVMKIMGQTIKMLTERVQELMSNDVHHRTIHTLLRLANDNSQKDEEGILLNTPITNQDLANMVGTSRETINRLLNQFKKEGLIEINKRKIRIKDMQSLKDSLS